MGQFDNSLPISPMIPMRHSLRTIVCKEVEVKLGVRVLDLVDDLTIISIYHRTK